MTDSQPLRITLPPLQITLQDQQQVTLQWLTQALQSGQTQGLSPQPIPPLKDEWKQWVAINKLLEQPDQGLCQRMIDHGIDSNLAQQEVTEVKHHPYFKAGERFVQQLQKLESLLKIQQQLSTLAPQSIAVDRKIGLSRIDFLNQYYARNTPVILTGIMNNWKALRLWNPEYFQQNYGDVQVEVQANRDSDPDYELNVDSHRQTMKFGDYIDQVVQTGESNNYYIVANNGNFDREEMRGLLQDIEIFPEYLNPQETQGRIFFWFGPQGTVTPLHHDPVNLMLAQVLGRKRILLILPQQTPYLYNQVGVFSKVNIECPDYEKYPLFNQVKPIEIILEPGEVIFIPVGWWHYVRSLDTSISVSFTNFVFPNAYDWKNPTFGR
ncbi:MAG: cupin-like domain-containing protein [Oscillatoriales cyanobacterium RM2_1_1]|nr:cupin-like domain-containing protein [Oscillatoriales cyanobacterium SM2_3_0]NJO46261.1 cupin-like domain-containing protein [Oscillatoriales cyanobacterium RM2_1_1]